MRKLLAVLIVVSFCSWTSLSLAQDLKLGFIDLKKVLDNYGKVKEGEDKLLKEAEAKNQQREKMVNAVQKLREQIDLLKDKEREKKEQQLDQELKKLQDFTNEMRNSLRAERDEKLREIMKEIKTVIDEYGQSRNYNLIIDDTLLLYKNKGLDVTDDIIKTLNQRYKKTP